MKKSIKKSSRRKWVVGGVAFFGSIALLTTGFATWVVGVQQTQEEGDVNVTVNTTTNESIRFEAELSDAAITLAETKAKSDGKIINEKEPVENALDITFSTLKITMGKNATKPNGLKMTIDTSANKNQQIIAKTYEFSDHSEDSGLTYIAAPKSISLDKTAGTGTVTETPDEQGNIVWEINNKTFSFEWGTYFDNVSPCNYYNSFFSSSEPTQADVDAVTAEMTAMHDAFNAPNNTITLTLELTFSE